MHRRQFTLAALKRFFTTPVRKAAWKKSHKERRSNSRVATVTFVIGLLVFAFVLEGQFVTGGILIPRSGIRFNESAAPTGRIVKAAGASVIYADVDHHLKLSNNNLAFGNVMTDAAASIPDAALTSNVALLNRNAQQWSGTNLFYFGSGGTTPTLSATVAVWNTASNANYDIIRDNAAGANLSNGDILGNYGWTARANSAYVRIGRIDGIYTGNGTTQTGDIAFLTSNAGAPAERARLNATAFSNETGRIITSASTPTTSVAAGFCTTPSVAVDTGSGDQAGIITITTGTGCAAATGSVTVTFSTANGAYGTNTPSCTVTAFDGAAAWDTGVTWKTTAQSTTAFTVAFKNGGTNFTSSTTYKFDYHCWGK